MSTDATRANLERTLYWVAAIGLVAGGLLYAWYPKAGAGFLVGGMAGLLGFALMARFLRQMAHIDPKDFQIQSFRQGAARLSVYAVAFALAYRIDPKGMTAMIGALGGYVVVRVLVTAATWRHANTTAQAERETPPNR